MKGVHVKEENIYANAISIFHILALNKSFAAKIIITKEKKKLCSYSQQLFPRFCFTFALVTGHFKMTAINFEGKATFRKLTSVSTDYFCCRPQFACTFLPSVLIYYLLYEFI